MRALWSSSRDVYANLALEESLLDDFGRDGPTLLFYVNDPAVVIGKNQNPWRECDVAWMRRAGVPLGRRVSGGGAVYHDPGNLNYALVLPRHGYAQGEIFRRIVAALLSLGIASREGAGHGLFAGDRKFSGNAFCFRGDAVLHHGTVLVNADLARLQSAVGRALPGIETRAIPSRPARVVNLADLKPGLQMGQVVDALRAEFAPESSGLDPAPPVTAARVAHHASWVWAWGHTPGFSFTIETAEGALRLQAERGLVTTATVTWCRDRVESLPALHGCPFDSRLLAARMEARHESWRNALLDLEF